MSRIALSPNASGTGTLTIAAPNTNADRTLTLPDTTGTVVLNEGSGTFKIASSGNVGIGTSSPAQLLEVAGNIQSTVNGTSSILALSGDNTNYSALRLRQSSTVSRIENLIAGTGAYTPIAINAGGSERMRIDTSGNVGIGTSSPTHNASAGSVVAQINGPSANAAVLHLTNGTTGSAANDGLILARWNDDTNYLWTYENEAIAFGTNNLERMRIDSAGRVTMPYQPAFSAKHTATEGPGTNSPLTQWGVQVNVGGGAFSNGRYTAPIAGNYLISLSLLQNTGTGSSGVNLTRNGSIIYRVMYAVTGYGYQMASGTYILSLAANDYIEFTNEVGGIQWYGDATGLGAMTVQLIG
jgi:hypothetical protein